MTSPQRSPRRYGRKGFTDKPAVRALLASHERPPGGNSHQAHLRDVPAASAAQLLDKLPARQADERVADDAPTFADLVKAALTCGAVLHGRRTLPDDPNERITFDSVEILPPEVNDESLRLLIAALGGGPIPLKITERGGIAIRWGAATDE